MPAPGRIGTVSIDVEALFDLWNLDPKNSTLGSTLTATGTTPPAVTLTGTLIVPYGIRVEITGAGALGVAVFRVSLDNGTTWLASGVTTAATYAVPGTAIVLNFAAGTYATDNVYRATVATAVDVSAAINATQATPANQPFFNAADASFNANSTWQFPNAATTTALQASFASRNGPLTYVAVGQLTGTPTVTQILLASDVSVHHLMNITGSGNPYFALGSQRIFRGAGTILQPSIVIAQLAADANTAQMWINGTWAGLKVGAALASISQWMVGGNSTSPWTGRVADLRVASRLFSLTERLAVFKYFSNKHNIPIAQAV